MPNNRVKTSKALQSKKGKAALAKLHPHSRRAKQLTRVALRIDKTDAGKRERRKVEVAKVDRLLWFTNALDPSHSCVPVDAIHLIVGEYIARNDGELAEEVQERRAGRPKSAKHERLEAERKREETEYKSGIVIPDLTLPEAVLLLRQWADEHRGDPSFFPRIRLLRITQGSDDIVVEQEGAAAGVTYGFDEGTADGYEEDAMEA